MPDREFWSVIPAGGSGTRLWPLSRASRPKYLLPLVGDRSLLQQTWERLLPLSKPERIIVVAGMAHAPEIARQLPDLPVENMIIEPLPRGTGPAIGLAARLIAERDPTAIMGSFAADHVVRDAGAFVDAVRTAVSVARGNWLVTIGIEPTRPETGYGYIERTTTRIDAAEPGVAWMAAGFTEKPSYERAVEFLSAGRFLWNASMFIWGVEHFLNELGRFLPDLYFSLERIARAWHSNDADLVLNREWNTVESVTIDEGIMEQSDRIAVVPAEFGWSDIGDWHGLAGLMQESTFDNAIRGNVIAHDARSTLVWSTTNRLVAVVGVHDLAIIDTPDALLVVDRDRAQEVRAIVDRLKKERQDLV
ncbi:MAG: mannose-1-phosphate guanylyltransferase [Thermomicrobiales bacterium]